MVLEEQCLTTYSVFCYIYNTYFIFCQVIYYIYYLPNELYNNNWGRISSGTVNGHAVAIY